MFQTQRFVDLGNGYARLEGYSSPYASLTFPLGTHIVGRLYCQGYADRDLAIHMLLSMGYRVGEAKFFIALWEVDLERALAGHA